MFNRRLKSASLILASLAALAGCMEKSPESILKQYLTYFSNADYKNAYTLLSVQDTKFMTQEEFSDRSADSALLWSEVSFKIKSKPAVTDDTAKVAVDITSPDIRPLMKDAMKIAMASALSKEDGGNDDSGDALQQMLEEKIKEGKLPTMTQEQTYELVKESGEWKVVLGFAKQEKIKDLLSEAKDLREQNKLNVAKAKYEEVLELDSELVEAKTGLDETKGEIASFEEKQAYIKNVELYDLKSKYYSVPDEWKEGAVKAKITDIEFMAE